MESSSFVLNLEGCALTEAASLFCDRPQELAMYARDRLTHVLMSSPIRNTDKALNELLISVSLDVSKAFGRDYVLELIDSETEDLITYITEADGMMIVIDSVEEPVSVELH